MRVDRTDDGEARAANVGTVEPGGPPALLADSSAPGGPPALLADSSAPGGRPALLADSSALASAQAAPRGPRSRAQGGSRYVARAVARAVWERDAAQCTFVDAEGRRCGERRFLTLEHREPHALGGAATVENLCLYCKSHNLHQGRALFGRGHVMARQKAARAVEPEVAEVLIRALRELGFHERDARRVVQGLDEVAATPPQVLLRRAILRLTP